MEWVALIIAILAIVAAIQFWPITLAIIVTWVLVVILRNELRGQREARETAQRLKHEHWRQQEIMRSSLVKLGDLSLSLFETLPRDLMTAEELLNSAEKDFEERAFAPFWESVERATEKLGNFNEAVSEISENAAGHRNVAQTYEGKVPAFPISRESMRAARTADATIQRLRALVRKAQRDFQFATIFEQRKTNNLLVAGFSTLAEAVDGVGSRIESSFCELGRHVSDISQSMSELSQTVKVAGDTLSENLHSIHARMENYSSDASDRHQKVIHMLDNIQRRRRPKPSEFCDGEY